MRAIALSLLGQKRRPWLACHAMLKPSDPRLKPRSHCCRGDDGRLNGLSRCASTTLPCNVCTPPLRAVKTSRPFLLLRYLRNADAVSRFCWQYYWNKHTQKNLKQTRRVCIILQLRQRWCRCSTRNNLTCEKNHLFYDAFNITIARSLIIAMRKDIRTGQCPVSWEICCTWKILPTSILS